MKIGVVGAGAVGTACMFALALRGSAREIVLVNRNRDRARGAVTDLRYGAVLAPHITLRAADYQELRGAAVAMITAGANEKSGGATDRNDSAGRLRLLASIALPHCAVRCSRSSSAALQQSPRRDDEQS